MEFKEFIHSLPIPMKELSNEALSLFKGFYSSYLNGAIKGGQPETKMV